MPKDTDGTNWMTVRYTLDIQVMAETADEALYFADLALPEILVAQSIYDLSHTGVVVEED